MRKGFYFSFDALFALLIMSTSIVMVGHSSDISTDTFEANTVEYRKSSRISRDALKLGSIDSFRWYNDSFQDDLKSDTVMEDEDLNRTILDGITLLWAARNLSYAETAAKTYFEGKIDGGYDFRLEVREGDDKNTIYRTGTMPPSPSSVSSTSRLVSGHKIDKPSEGFQARARATETEKNQTKVINIPMMGSGAQNLRYWVDKKFKLNATEIHNATLYFSAHWGTSNFNSNEIKINGQEVDIGGSDSSDWAYYAEKNSNHLGYDITDVTSEVQDGWNTFHMKFIDQTGEHAHLHPGTRIRVKYSTKKKMDERGNLTDYFANIESKSTGGNSGGAWVTKSINIPENASVHNVSLRLHVKNIEDDPDHEDLQVYLNDQKVHGEDMSGDATKTFQFKDQVENGTNVLSVYANTVVQDGEITEFTGEGDNPTIYSDPEDDASGSSRLYVNYTEENGGLKFGRIRVRTSEEIGGSRANPKEFTETFENTEIQHMVLNLAQLDSRNVTVEAGSDSLGEVFESPREFATPTEIAINLSSIEEGEENDFKVSEECSVDCSILPESSLEKDVYVSSQVQYGELFKNRSFAVDDAKERLRDQLGDYADATSIASDTLSTGDQPYLWGPASVKLVVWDD